LPASLCANTSVSIHALDAFQRQLTPFNSTPDDDDDDDDDDDEFQTRNEFWIERVKVYGRKVLRGAVKSGGENEESRGAT
jgi:hypothetical protein